MSKTALNQTMGSAPVNQFLKYTIEILVSAAVLSEISKGLNIMIGYSMTADCIKPLKRQGA